MFEDIVSNDEIDKSISENNATIKYFEKHLASCDGSQEMTKVFKEKILSLRSTNSYLLELRHRNSLLHKQLVADERYRVQQADWLSMRGVEFERYISDVLKCHGYQVKCTPTTGDFGADLIASKSTRMIAIQVKGMQNSVGNGAIQQAIAGMAFYQCNTCVVITNSTFTRAAIKQAQAMSDRCKLIDKHSMKILITTGL